MVISKTPGPSQALDNVILRNKALPSLTQYHACPFLHSNQMGLAAKWDSKCRLEAGACTPQLRPIAARNSTHLPGRGLRQLSSSLGPLAGHGSRRLNFKVAQNLWTLALILAQVGQRWGVGHPGTAFHFHLNKSFHQTSSSLVGPRKRFFSGHHKSPTSTSNRRRE